MTLVWRGGGRETAMDSRASSSRSVSGRTILSAKRTTSAASRLSPWPRACLQPRANPARLKLAFPAAPASLNLRARFDWTNRPPRLPPARACTLIPRECSRDRCHPSWHFDFHRAPHARWHWRPRPARASDARTRDRQCRNVAFLIFRRSPCSLTALRTRCTCGCGSSVCSTSA